MLTWKSLENLEESQITRPHATTGWVSVYWPTAGRFLESWWGPETKEKHGDFDECLMDSNGIRMGFNEIQHSTKGDNVHESSMDSSGIKMDE